MTITINIPAQHDARVLEAFGAILNLGRDATEPEVTLAGRTWYKQSVQDYERRKAMAAFVPGDLGPGL